ARRRGPEPDQAGEGRADLFRHADEQRARHADDGAVARRPDRPSRHRPGARHFAVEPTCAADRVARAIRVRDRPAGRRPTCGRRAAGRGTARRRELVVDDQSIWKKEISFGRKRKPAQPEPEDKAAESAPDEPTSIWKKELSFGRKKKPAEVVTPPEDTDASGDVQGSKPEPGPEETAPAEQHGTKAAANSGPGEAEADAAETGSAARGAVEAVAEEAAAAADASGDVQ